jgi:hypothetical protein
MAERGVTVSPIFFAVQRTFNPDEITVEEGRDGSGHEKKEGTDQVTNWPPLPSREPESTAGQYFHETICDQALETAISLGVVSGPSGLHVL